jgi:hypothetical protein
MRSATTESNCRTKRGDRRGRSYYPRACRRLTSFWFTVLAIALPLICCQTGCKQSAEDKTVAAANERARDLEQEKQQLEAEKRGLIEEIHRKDAELATAKTNLSGDFQSQLNGVKELHEQRESELQKQISGFQLRLASIEQEKNALQEIVDDRTNLPGQLKERMNLERAVWAALLIVVLVPLLFMSARYYALRHAVGPVLLRRASSAQVLTEER